MVTSYHFRSYINMILQLITLSFQRFFYLNESGIEGVGFNGKLWSRVSVEVSLPFMRITL